MPELCGLLKLQVVRNQNKRLLSDGTVLCSWNVIVCFCDRLFFTVLRLFDLSRIWLAWVLSRYIGESFVGLFEELSRYLRHLTLWFFLCRFVSFITVFELFFYGIFTVHLLVQLHFTQRQKKFWQHSIEVTALRYYFFLLHIT